MNIDCQLSLTSIARKPKILFVAFAHSSHTQSWINLLNRTDFDVLVFGINGTIAPSGFPFQVISTGILNTSCWLSEYLRWRIAKTGRVLLSDALQFKFLNYMARNFGQSNEWFSGSEQELLAHIIMTWKPDIIHTFGIDPASFLYQKVITKFGLEGVRSWVVTALGGSDFEPVRYDPVCRGNISSVLKACTHFIADCDLSYHYAIELGLDSVKIIHRGKTPGTGGIDINKLRELRKTPPSKQRMILFPKAYECPYSKALPVLEAIILCWDSIAPCTVHLTAIDDETHKWYLAMPEKIRKNCKVDRRLPQEQLLNLMANSRIVLAPTLVDGFPNTLYESMATGAFPIFSPLLSFKDSVKEGKNLLFARNLYPDEIAKALVRGMNDDELVDFAAEQNLALVKKLADRSSIVVDIVNFYRSIV